MRTALEIVGAVGIVIVGVFGWCCLRIAAESDQHPPTVRNVVSMPPRSRRAGMMADPFDASTWDD